jgi:Tol biopolymer transport system component
VSRIRLAIVLGVVATALLSVGQAQATFPGKNGKIAFERFNGNYSEGFNYHLFTMSPDGSAQANLSGNDFYDFVPAWSPDGTQIAFSRDAPRPNTTGNPSIYTIKADGAALTSLTNGVSPAWSPDGTKIAFSQGDPLADHIDTMNTDGSGRISVTPDEFGTVDGSPDWSPDGTKIAFMRCLLSGFAHGSASYSECQIWTTHPDGTGQTKISNSSTFDGAPSWSPDSTKIAFVRREDNHGQIYTMHADGSNRTRISQEASITDTTPVWSPDGTKIAFARHEPGAIGGQIFIANTDGSARVNLSNSTTDDRVPDWQAIPGPRRSDYKNAAQFCKAEGYFLGDTGFAAKYGTNRNAANAHGKCVSQKN